MRLLVIAATVIELEWVEGVETLATGVGPVEAAAGASRRLAVDPPDAVLHVGIAGARRAAGLDVGTIVVGSEARYGDLRAAIPSLTTFVTPNPSLLALVRAALPGALCEPIATTAAVGAGDPSCRIEAMEGFAVLRAAERAGIPAVEVRAVSNEIEEADRSKWDFAGGLEALAAAGRRVLAGL
jgi:futalosine hydrolase